MKMHLQSQLEQIKMLALDVDGVLTDGTINIGELGEVLSLLTARMAWDSQCRCAPWTSGSDYYRQGEQYVKPEPKN
jgi:hypothetical protein